MYVGIKRECYIREYITLEVDIIKRKKRIKRKEIKWYNVGKKAKSESLKKSREVKK